MMKKLIALLMTAILALGCAAALAEEGTTTIESADGAFSISFQLPEDVRLLSGNWVDDSIYMANLAGADGLYFYLSVAAPLQDAEEDAEETAPVTFNEENGYTDEFLKDMIDDLYADDGVSYDKGVQTTAHGTKLAVVRFNDPESPSVYIFSKWQGYEIGVTVALLNDDGIYQPINDDQVQKVVDFLSEVWMNTKEAEAPAA